MKNRLPSCPTCMSNEHVRTVKSVGNAVLRLANEFIFDDLVNAHGMPLIQFRIYYKCTRCNVAFRRLRITGPTTRCPNCEYELYGNISGVCPECGRVIPEAIKKWIADSPRKPE